MLERLLAHVAEGGIHSHEELARWLSIPWPLLEAMLADLTRLGYLRAIDARCGGHCSGCAAGQCLPEAMRSGSVAGLSRLWTLTEKGARAVARLSA